MIPYPINLYRPTPQADGEGGWNDDLGTPVEIYGSVVIHRDKTILTYDVLEDVRTGDILGVQNQMLGEVEAFYKVVEVNLTPGASMLANAVIERVSKPIQAVHS